MPKTFKDLKDEIRQQIWAAGEAENLVSAHDFHFQEALGDISLWVDCEKRFNVNVVDFCQTHFKCGVTVLSAPQGIIRRLYTVANRDFCDPVMYRQMPYDYLMAWAQQLAYIVSANKAAVLPLGYRPADASTDSQCGRARQGYWAIYKGNLFVAPWIQSMESVVFEWDGVKEQWQDADLVSYNQQYRKAVKLFVQFAHERDFGAADRAAQFKTGYPLGSGGYDQALADLMWKCREETREHPDPLIMAQPTPGYMSPVWLEKGLPTAPVAPKVFAHIGNFYGATTDMNNVGALVRQMSPQGILASGLIYGASTDSYDPSVGFWFHDYLAPYLGVNGEGAAGGNAFWPAVAQSDWNKDQCQTWLAWFATNQKLHYTQCFGAVQYFFLDSSALEPDGNWPDSQQAKMLQVQLAMSTAPWKVVVLSDCPYGSVRHNPLLQWPFRQWGVQMVLCSGAVNYERLDVNGLVVINNGLGGGGSLEPVSTPDANSKFIYAGGFGSGRITANETGITYQFVGVDGTLLDTITLGNMAADTASTSATPGSSLGFTPTGGVTTTDGRLHGSGSPSADLGQPGDTYVDDVTGAFYWKSITGWKP